MPRGTDIELHYPDALPISIERQRIVQAITENRSLVIAGDTGSGKTTQLPKMCIEAGLAPGKMIACTQPRRIAAISMASRVSEELGRPELVGYAVRFQDRTGPETVIKFLTDGLLLAEYRRDRLLSRYGIIIVDEVHERSLNIDFLLGSLKQLLKKRKNLKIILSSATIDTEKFSKHFGSAPIIRVSGRTWPITIHHDDDDIPLESDDYVSRAVNEVEMICTRPGGDILVFMPTERDILDTTKALARLEDKGGHLVLPLYGRLPGPDQRKIFRPTPARKIIVATNVAETSITVPGIRFVVDTGLARIPAYNVRARTTSMQIQKISRSACDQRAGRCGRTGPGTCIRLFSEEDYASRPEFTRPEIQRSNLAEVILQMISLGLGDPRTFPFLDPPTGRAVSEGFKILRELGAIDQDNRLTDRGRTMARLPLDPRIARIIIEANQQGCLREIVVICSVLSIQDPRLRPPGREEAARQAQQCFIDTRSDFLTLFNIWNQWQDFSGGAFSAGKLKKFCQSHLLSWQRMREWFDIQAQILRLLKQEKGFEINKEAASYAAIHQALTSGFLRNIGRRKETTGSKTPPGRKKKQHSATQKKHPNIYTISGGREVTIFPGSVLHNNKRGRWIVAADFVETSRLFARTAAIIDEKWLEELGGDLCRRSWSDPFWSKKAGQVQAMERVSLFGLPIVAGRRINYGRISSTARQEARQIFINQALIQGKLGGRYDFLQHNLGLQNKIARMEERLRTRGLLADDATLYAFYDARLAGVYDRFTLNRLLKKKKGDGFLKMREEDICLRRPDDDELYRFPKTLPAGPHSLKLHYHFEPGADNDGVTVRIPRELCRELPASIFEWLVPGLLAEKVLALLKGLPKKIRRHLVPLPDAVDRILDRIDLYEGSLYPALERAVRREFQISIERRDWRADALASHLRMRFELVDSQGRILLATRDLHELRSFQDHLRPGPDQEKPKNTQKKPPERQDVDKHILDTLLEMNNDVSRHRAGLFPTLKNMGNDRIDLVFVNDVEEARQQGRTGLLALYLREFPGLARTMRRACRDALTSHSASWLALGCPWPQNELREMLYSFVLEALFDLETVLFPSLAAFEAQTGNLRKEGAGARAMAILSQTMDLLSSRRSTLATIREWSSMGRTSRSHNPDLEQEFFDCLEAIIPADFLQTKRFADLEQADRQLRALAIRVERASQNPAKDAAKAMRLQQPMHWLDELNSMCGQTRECRQGIRQYRALLEEFRISVFAPEVGTRQPVSEKRLKKAYLRARDLCHRVE